MMDNKIEGREKPGKPIRNRAAASPLAIPPPFGNHYWYKAIFEHSPIAAGVFQLDGMHLLDANQALIDLLGFSVDELVVLSEEKLGKIINLEVQRQVLARLLETGSVTEFEATLLARSGRRVEVSVTAHLIAIDDEQFIAAQIVEIGERKRLQQTLSASEAKLNAVIHELPVGVWVVDAAGRMTDTNPAADAIWAGSAPLSAQKEQYLEYETWDYLTGKRLEVHEYPLIKTIETRSPYPPTELLIKRFDGSMGVVMVSAMPINNSNGELIGAVGINVDITAQKRNEEALARINRELREYINQRTADMTKSDLVTRVGDWQIDVTDRKFKGSDELFEIFDIDKSDCVSPFESFFSRIHPDDKSLVQETSLKSRETGLPWNINYRIITTSGTQKWIHEIGQVLKDADGKIISVTGISQDITHFKVLEEKLREKEEDFLAIFINTSDGLALLNPQGEIIASNPAMEKITGYTSEELYAKRLNTYLHHDDAIYDEALHNALFDGKPTDFQAEKRIICKEGQVRWVNLAITRTPGGNDGSGFSFARLEDITEAKRDQEALIKSEKLALIGRLGASLAHEINNPLQAAIGCLGLAMEDQKQGGEAQTLLPVVMEELERGARIVSQLRDLGNLSRTMVKSPGNINAIIEKTLLLTRKRCMDHGVEVEWSPCADLPLVTVVADNIQQVFLNLILNALDAMPQGGIIRIGTNCQPKSEGITITIADTGCGIEKERLERIFEPFYTTHQSGMGLGLYISKKIVESHKGRITVDSEVGAGTAFEIWLPD